MKSVSQEYLNSVRGSHKSSTRARILTTFQTGDFPGGEEINVINGSVQSEAEIFGRKIVKGALVRSSLDVTVIGHRQWPDESSDLLAPFGNEIFVERGIDLGSGEIEFIGLGYFRINDIQQNIVPNGSIRITGSDRMSGIEDGRFTRPRQFLPGTTLGDIVNELITDIYPDAVIEWDDNTDEAVLGRVLVFEKERVDALIDLVTSVGKMVFWDGRGILVIRDVPNSTNPVFTVNSGENGVLTEMSRSLTRDGVYNGVVATGEAADTTPPVTAIAVDNGTDSPTQWGGSFGKVPRFYSSPFIVTQPQAQSAARAILSQSIGIPYSVDFSVVPNIALEPLDPVLIKYPKQNRSIATRDEMHVIQRLTYPLETKSKMIAITREQKLFSIGFLV